MTYNSSGNIQRQRIKDFYAANDSRPFALTNSNGYPDRKFPRQRPYVHQQGNKLN